MAIPAYYSLIQKGSYGPDEALVQTWLNGVRDQCSYYPALTTDGRFGTKSENAVKEFQLRNNMNMDGKVGANTWNVLYAKYTAKHGLAVPYPGIVMRTGMSGGTIRLIQQKLNTLGEKIGTDGKFGSRTAAAVQRFQRRNGLTADGAAYLIQQPLNMPPFLHVAVPRPVLFFLLSHREIGRPGDQHRGNPRVNGKALVHVFGQLAGVGV